MKNFAVCEEILEDNCLSGCFSIRDKNDTNPTRFMVYGYFDSYDEAADYLAWLKQVKKRYLRLF